MRIFLIVIAAFLLTRTITACKSSSSGPATFCDTACLKDTLKFVNETHPMHPHVYISARNCMADTLLWSFEDMGVNRKIGFADVIGAAIHINKNYIACFIKDTSYAWLKFNDCSTGRGYILKVPYSRSQRMSYKSSALNSFDPKFAVADGLIAYSDRGNLFAEDEATGATAMMTFGSKVDIDYDAVHETVDSISVTRDKMWARVKIGNEWKVVEKTVEFK